MRFGYRTDFVVGDGGIFSVVLKAFDVDCTHHVGLKLAPPAPRPPRVGRA